MLSRHLTPNPDRMNGVENGLRFGNRCVPETMIRNYVLSLSNAKSLISTEKYQNFSTLSFDTISKEKEKKKLAEIVFLTVLPHFVVPWNMNDAIEIKSTNHME